MDITRYEAVMLSIAIFAATVGNLCDVEAVKLSPNPGYASALKSGQILIITFASVLLFKDTTLSMQGITGVALVLAGVVLLATIR